MDDLRTATQPRRYPAIPSASAAPYQTPGIRRLVHRA